ncbi:excinuclease ABC subunit UvrA [Lachnobacterium bovis]|uniref:UvrABC system protein A n=1 Tax=Lachnobacterium bovis DSM 14045 TaxID=1122142 RepID=A0A1H3HBY6_9FIRM|nr:excinuclease ABC subunit UvrA [Lachnobacterium bovis]SDY12927.1 excinuclease ABC subunit A [Lachnobacterium bovis DSM 14045]
MSKPKLIKIRGAKEHNLKNISVDIPRDEFVVFTGLSGSGKSSLAFDTIYAEGQRRYMESLSSYARQFLGQMEKPNVEKIEGLPPAISIDQKTTNRNPRSTVGTVTEIYDYFRLLYARIGVVHCPKCGREIKKQTIDQMVDSVMQLPERSKIQLLAPVVRGRKGTHQKLLEKAKKSGYVRVIVDGSLYDLSEVIELEKNKKHDISIVVDRLVVKEGIEKRLTDSLETVFHLTESIAVVEVLGGKDGENIYLNFSQNFACPDCGISIDEVEPRSFSFNNPFGACPTCYGLGYKMEFDEDLMIPDKNLSFSEGAVQVMGWQSSNDPKSYSYATLKALSEEYGFSLDTPYKDLPEEIRTMFIKGGDGRVLKVHYKGQRGEGVYDLVWEGLVNNVEKRYRETSSDVMKAEYEQFMRITPCKTCKGQRLKESSLAVTVGDKNIYEMTCLSIKDLVKYLDELQLNEQQKLIGNQILKEIKARVGFLKEVGLDYLSLARTASTLSGGEAQRIRLATQIGSGLVGVAYILDEPSIGLHQRDNEKLLKALMNLKDLGNTLIVVEHDEDTMKAADYIVDVGPKAGVHGGEIVATGTYEDIINNKDSITGAYLSGKIKIPVPSERREPTGWITVKGARENNLKNIDVDFPLGVLTCVTGVSGSGKSSLTNEILYKHLEKSLNRARTIAGDHDGIEGIEQLDKVIDIDQSPIGRTPRSNPATYTGVFDIIRDLFAATAEAKARGYKKGRFSFNVKGGRCEACRGDGILKIEMRFLPDVYVPCEVCGGKKYNRETLEIKYKGKSIYDVLDMTVEEALEFFKNVPRIHSKIQTLYDVGLSYIKLGQPSTELSGGEAQRVKLATELSKRSTGKTIYILDEPTTGLHFADVHKLVEILRKLSEGGNTVIVIEHNLEVIKTADYIIDMGPEGGEGGGQVVATGTPEEICKVEESYTGQFLKPYLK